MIFFPFFAAYCRVSGHYHFRTFDSLQYSFNGLCEYIAAQSDQSLWHDPEFGRLEVSVQGIKCGTGGNTCTYMAKITIANTVMKVVRGADLEIGSISVTGEYEDDGTRIAKNGNSVQIVNDQRGIIIVYDDSKFIF